VGPPLDTATHKLTREVVAAWNAHDLDRATAFYADHFQGHDIGAARVQRGPADFRRSFERLLQAFPDAHFHEDDIVVEGNRVALFWTLTGTHRGKFMGIPPTGRAIATRGVSYMQFEGEQVVQVQRVWDLAGVLRAIGLLPEL
jgi:steroid delta-isomerase-like uncharacterized protein